jgi:predicted amidohydrolase YtcJ
MARGRGPAACLALAAGSWVVWGAGAEPPADLLLLNGRVYTLAWSEPSADGTPATDAPRSAQGWHPDAEAVAIRGDRIVFVGSARDAAATRGPATRVIDLQGATVIPGLIDAHTHVAALGEKRARLDLTGVADEAQAVARVAARAAQVAKGHWIVGSGWDEGAWANHYPDMQRLSASVPDHPVALIGLHSFAVWGNRLAFQKAGITRETPAPAGGEIVKDASGAPTGVLLNQATALLSAALPPPTDAELQAQVLAGLEVLAQDGYVAVHEAGADARLLAALQRLERDGRLPVRVSVMLAARDEALCRQWLARGPERGAGRLLSVRTVKAFDDGALGSRGARLLEDYADRPGHRGLSGERSEFDRRLVADMMRAGFQVAIHAIGDAGNRETLDFIESVAAEQPAVRERRPRIEHAQVLSPQDIPRFARLGVIASMQPPHCVEDKGWAEDRLGPERVKGAYAWRSLRRAGARLALSSDLPGSDHNIFYGLHAAITRRDRQLQPAGGWHPQERLTPEEALRGYTTWNAYAEFEENETGVIAAGRRADLTVLDVDPLVLGESDPARLLEGKVRMTIVTGRVRANGGPASRLELVVLKGRLLSPSVNWHYTDPPRPDLERERLFAAGLADLDSYDWPAQGFTLTADATQRLLEALGQEPGPGTSIEKLNALKARLGHGNDFERVLYLWRFCIALDGEPMYWGIFLDPPSQMAIQFPVLRSRLEDGKAVFHVLPIHLPFYNADPVQADAGDAAAREYRDVPKGMMETFRELADSPTAAEFRRRIRDERIRQALERAGKLRP